MENSIDHIITRILSGNSSSEDFLSLSEWLNADEKNKKEFRLLKSYWDAEVSFSHSLMPNVSLDNLRKKIDDQSRQKRLRLIRFIATPIAAAIAFLVLFFATTHLNTREGKVQQFYTYITDKNKSHFTLDDGTKIILNRNSRFTYSDAYGTDQRKVNLEGEAYFEVAKDKEKPFIVKANGINVQALGTSFNIRAHKDDKSVAIILISGKVKVDDGRHEAYMKPNERLVCNLTNGQFEKSELHPNASNLLWRSNELALYGESFEEICTMLTRMYNCKFIFKNEKVKQYTYHGIIKNSSLNNVLEYISQAGGINYKIKSDNTIVIY